MHPGEIKAYAITIGPSKAFTASQGKGREDEQKKGIADKSVTVYREQLNDTSNSRLNGFINRAVTALTVTRGDLVIEDIHGRKMRGDSIENGANVNRNPEIL